jgi:cephalosporin-C deacetylase-like acetyl esterase
LINNSEKEIDIFVERRRIKLLINLLFVCLNNGCLSIRPNNDIIQPAKSLPSSTPWDLFSLSKSPQFEWGPSEGGVKSLYYQGIPYMGKETRVFAYYANPATLSDEPVKDNEFPAVVLVHGGGGTAFKEWVQLWAKRGYAAIAMDLAGCGPERKRLPDGGPGQSDKEKFGAIDQPVGDQWTYHAVANVILAHSLIRSFSEVDPSRTAVTGISWGGYLTSIVAGLDNRFKAAVPVYGCGFLHKNSVWLNQFAKMTPQQKDKWIQLWDPSSYIGSAKMPVFFVNGTNDFAYPLDSYAKTYRLVKNKKNYRITVNMPHSHQHGWAPEEIGLFIDQYLKNGIPLPTILRPKLTEKEVHTKVKSATKLNSANLYYTTGTKPINKLNWEEIPARIDCEHIISPAPPDDATIWFLTVNDNRGTVVSSEVTFSTD